LITTAGKDVGRQPDGFNGNAEYDAAGGVIDQAMACVFCISVRRETKEAIEEKVPSQARAQAGVVPNLFPGNVIQGLLSHGGGTKQIEADSLARKTGSTGSSAASTPLVSAQAVIIRSGLFRFHNDFELFLHAPAFGQRLAS
jgi:hypothetical protein